MNTDEKKKHRKLPRPQVDPEDRLESQTAIKPADLAELGPDEFEKRHGGPDIEDLVERFGIDIDHPDA